MHAEVLGKVVKCKSSDAFCAMSVGATYLVQKIVEPTVNSLAGAVLVCQKTGGNVMVTQSQLRQHATQV